MRTSMLVALATALPLAAAAPALAQQQPQNQMQQSQKQPPAAHQNSGMPGNQSANLSESQIRQVQQALDQKGFHAGRADGKLGPETKDALSQFQKKQGLQATGEPDDQTLAALGIGGGASTTGQGQQNGQPQGQQPSTQPQPAGKK
jgi:peptidoglycan hydrolase-like protein with peptidoglycan-binding domain